MDSEFMFGDKVRIVGFYSLAAQPDGIAFKETGSVWKSSAGWNQVRFDEGTGRSWKFYRQSNRQFEKHQCGTTRWDMVVEKV